MFFQKIKEGLAKTNKAINDKLNNIIKSFTGKIDEEFLEELEEILVLSDMGIATSKEVIASMRATAKSGKIFEKEQLVSILKAEIVKILDKSNAQLCLNTIPSIILVVGVNGVGKTTTIGKLANNLIKQGKKVAMAAADTFRAGAIDQIDIWAQRAKVEIIKHEEGADPAAVVFDGIKYSKNNNIDILICDTAGRLHNKKNLMDELEKIKRIIDRELPNADKEILLVLDATTGQNAIVQAKSFLESVDITGIVLTKLDGTAKGGVVVGICNEINIPVKFIGVGEKIDDIQQFNSIEFVDALLS